MIGHDVAQVLPVEQVLGKVGMVLVVGSPTCFQQGSEVAQLIEDILIMVVRLGAGGRGDWGGWLIFLLF